METSYNFLQVKNNCTYFARVFIELGTKVENPIVITQAERNSSNKDKGADPDTYKDWYDAAENGAKEALSQLRVTLKQHALPNITIVKVYGTEVDTTDNTVFCAAAMATWSAINPNGVQPVFVYLDGNWSLNYEGRAGLAY